MSETRKQLARFVAVGLLATLADATVYAALLFQVLPDQTTLSKGLAFVVGTTVSFVLNKLWTFESKERDGREAAAFVSLYTASLGLNVGVNHVVLLSMEALGLPLGIARPIGFLSATTTSMVVNFLGQKFWVFRTTP
jgi:putative flippase GtrA